MKKFAIALCLFSFGSIISLIAYDDEPQSHPMEQPRTCRLCEVIREQNKHKVNQYEYYEDYLKVQEGKTAPTTPANAPTNAPANVPAPTTR